MVRLAPLLVSSLATLGACASAVIDLIPGNFDDVVLKSGKPALVEFFAPWCGHCKNLAPVYEELAQSYQHHDKKVTVAKVDADANKDLGRRFGVQGFPTLKWFDGKSDTPQDYSSGRDLESLQEFIKDKTGLKAKGVKKAESKVHMLTDADFSKQVGGDKDVLVAFTAPWCGRKSPLPPTMAPTHHSYPMPCMYSTLATQELIIACTDCKALAPTWESLAEDFETESGVLVAKVDAEAPQSKKTADEFDIKSYPTIKFFPKGSSKPEEYDGGRSEQDFVTFINGKAGTHRTVGGGLDATGGTIAAMDAVVQSILSKRDDLEAGLAEVKKAAGDVKDQSQSKFAQYYVKVTEKLKDNKEYAEKESKRLASLLSKGGLAPEKRDDLTSRSNILKKFLPVEEGKSEL